MINYMVFYDITWCYTILRDITWYYTACVKGTPQPWLVKFWGRVSCIALQSSSGWIRHRSVAHPSENFVGSQPCSNHQLKVQTIASWSSWTTPITFMFREGGPLVSLKISYESPCYMSCSVGVSHWYRSKSHMKVPKVLFHVMFTGGGPLISLSIP